VKDYLSELVRQASDALRARNSVREYLQARILAAFQSRGAMIPLAFHGGTALRFVYGSRRFSEDLDFALERAHDQYDFRGCLGAARAALNAEDYGVEVTFSDRRPVHAARLRFPGLLFELGLSPRREEVFTVKIEVDTKPPEGAVLETSVVRRHLTLRIQHHDRASLLAGKLHAILHRPYLKGRDVYDLLWYLADRDLPEPNLVMLNNALRRTGWTGRGLTSRTWPRAVEAKVAQSSWERAQEDVRPFLETTSEVALLGRENLLQLVRSRRAGRQGKRGK
jgi:predicted nucleotidyltransferase component of viral defense system